MGAFFCLDGMSTGATFLHVQGISVHVPERPADLSGREHSSMKIYRIFGSNMLSHSPESVGPPLWRMIRMKEGSWVFLGGKLGLRTVTKLERTD